MSILRKFKRETSGVGIVEYLLILCLVGSIVVVISPSLRQSVGEMYEEQQHSTQGMNGVRGSDSAGRYVVGSEQVVYKLPNVQINNEGEIEITADPTAEGVSEEQKTITVSATKLENNFESTLEYDNGDYFGTLQRSTSPPQEVVVDSFRETLTKDDVEIVQKATLEEMENTKGYEKTDFEGYVGMMNPTGDIQYIPVNTNENVIEKSSGEIVIVKESDESQKEVMKDQFPDSYYYEEMDSNTGTYTGYKGYLTKQGELNQVLYQEGGLPKYRYEQVYSGTIGKGSFTYAYVYQQEFSGTLFKTEEQNIVEYTQTYSGVVTRKR